MNDEEMSDFNTHANKNQEYIDDKDMKIDNLKRKLFELNKVEQNLIDQLQKYDHYKLNNIQQDNQLQKYNDDKKDSEEKEENVSHSTTTRTGKSFTILRKKICKNKKKFVKSNSI